MTRRLPSSLLATVLACSAASAVERINHAGRILGPVPSVTTPILFNTAAADAVVAAMQILPRDSAWNEDVSGLPLAANSAAMIAMIRNDVYAGSHADRRRLVVFKEMNYVLVPDAQARVDIDFTDYPDESDDLKTGSTHLGWWPIPGNLPVETWPSETSGVTLSAWQRDTAGGDRHSITVMPGSGWIWETWQTLLTSGTPAWRASNGAKFPLTSNTPRPAGWTSGDAAGLPMFPALVRYDEVQRGAIEHAMRIVVKRSRQAYIYPASHQAGSTTDPDVPAMGQRLRLKATFAIPASWSAAERAIAAALKTYGAIVADNGGFFSISICPDDRWPSGAFSHLATGAGSDYLDINNFEVVQATGASAGPRSPGAPTAAAGVDQSVTIAAGAALVGSATGSGLTVRWSAYAGAPGTVTFGDATALATTAMFSAIGTYTLRLAVSDGVHTPAYDAVVVTVAVGTNPLPVLNAITPDGRNQNGGAFVLTLTGTNFVPATVVHWTGRVDLVPSGGSAISLTCTVPAGYLAISGMVGISVSNPGPGGGTSAEQQLQIVAGGTVPQAGTGAGGGGGCGFGAVVALVGLAGTLAARRCR